MEPVLDIFFSEDRHLQPRVGPPPTFRRTGPGMMVGADRKLRWGPENLLRSSEDLTSTRWQKAAVTVTQTSDSRFNSVSQVVTTTAKDEHFFYQDQVVFLPMLRSPVAMQFYVRRQPVAGQKFLLVNSPDLGLRFSINLDNGVVKTNDGGVQVDVEPDGWLRVRASGFLTSIVAGARFFINQSDSLNPENYTGDGTGIWVTQFKLQRNDVVESYDKTLDEPYFGPRFIYDPFSGRSMGLLFEQEERTNLLKNSVNYGGAAWRMLAGSGFSSGSVLNDAIGPDGSWSGDRITELWNAMGKMTLEQSVDVQGDKFYTLSLFAKFHSRRYLSLVFKDDKVREQIFDLQAKAPGQFKSDVVNAYVIPSTGDWMRLVMVIKTSVNVTTGMVQIGYTNTDQSASVGYEGLGAYNWLWHSQFELGDSPSTPIITGDAKETRTPDLMEYTGTSFNFWNQAEGTILLDYWATGAETYRPYVKAFHTTNEAGARISIGNAYSGDLVEAAVVNAGGQFIAVKQNVRQHKVGLAYKQGANAASTNGATMDPTSNNVMAPPTVDKMAFGGFHVLSRIRVYPKAMTQAELNQVTTP